MKRTDYKNELFTELFPESDNTLEIMNLLTNMFCSQNGDKEWKNTVHCMSKEELKSFREEIFDKEFSVFYSKYSTCKSRSLQYVATYEFL